MVNNRLLTVRSVKICATDDEPCPHTLVSGMLNLDQCGRGIHEDESGKKTTKYGR